MQKNATMKMIVTYAKVREKNALFFIQNQVIISKRNYNLEIKNNLVTYF